MPELLSRARIRQTGEGSLSSKLQKDASQQGEAYIETILTLPELRAFHLPFLNKKMWKQWANVHRGYPPGAGGTAVCKPVFGSWTKARTGSELGMLSAPRPCSLSPYLALRGGELRTPQDMQKPFKQSLNCQSSQLTVAHSHFLEEPKRKW